MDPEAPENKIRELEVETRRLQRAVEELSILNAIIDYSRLVVESRPGESHRPAARNLELIEVFEDEGFDVGGRYEEEAGRQLADLRDLEAGAHARWLRKRSQGALLFDGGP